MGKTPVAGARDRNTHEVDATPLAGTGKGELQGFVRGQAEAGAQLYSDEAAAYAGMAEFAHEAVKHEAVKHSAGEYVRGQAHVNGLESFRALLKRGYHGTYHHMSPQHLKRYVTEFAGRHNNRRADTAEQMRRMVHGLLGKTLTYRQLTGQTAAAR